MSDGQEYVYAIGHPHGYVKIGRSVSPDDRLSQHQTSSPYDLWIIVQLPVDDAPSVEKTLHERFEDKRVNGEWFELDSQDYDLLTEFFRMANSKREFDSVDEYRQYRNRRNVSVLG